MWKSLTFAVFLAFGLGNLLWADPPTKETGSGPGETGQTASQPVQTEPESTRTQPDSSVAAAPDSSAEMVLPTPLPSDLFQAGRIRDAYQAANEMPDVFAQLKCYCGCDQSFGHRHLLDCFVDGHGAG